MFQKNLAGIAAAAVLFFCLSCGNSKHSKSIMPGTWQPQPIVIDGDSKDWPSPYPNYDSKAMVAYATSNDRQNLYITMETGDQLTQLKILKQGMTVSIDTGGKKDPEFNINYPLQNDNDPLEMVRQAGGLKKSGSSSHDMENLQMAKKIDKNADEDNQFALIGFSSCDGGYLVTQTTPCGIKIRMKMDEYKELVWEAAIPFKAIYGRSELTAADAGKPISVCFAVKAFKRPESKGAVENNNGTMNQSAGGGGMKSGMKGGGGRTQEDPYAHLYENTKTWKQFGVAFQ